MSILRFRVTFDDYDDIHRDIDLQVDHSFADFFFEILKSIGFDSKHEGEFFLADHNWRKGESIGKISGEDQVSLKKVDLVDHIDDPHQKFLFIYDQEVRWSFNIELIKIMGSPEYKAVYPKVASSVGVPPVQYKETLIIPTRERPLEDGRGRKPKAKVEEDDDDLLLMALAGAVDDEEETEELEGEEIALSAEDLETDTEIAKLAEEFNNTTEVDENDSQADAFGSNEDDDEFGAEGGEDDEYGSYGGGGGGSDYDE
ncbi:MAG TPA: hypothetical protein PLS08_12770 [Chryseolinea sp.]|nr:hypothetical protein [Chryseolinea sp.]HPH81447.1 hypothetical protein [Flavobacteriales bacterium]